MITKILYQFNESNKRIITGLVENDKHLDYDPLYEYPMILEETLVLEEGERVVSNFGRQHHAVFVDGDKKSYLNFNDFMLKVKLGLTENLAFSATLSKDMLSAILDNTNYFDTELDVIYIDAGLSLGKTLEYKDAYDGWFRKVTDDVYCQFNYDKSPLFVGKVDNNYVLVDDFKKAVKVSKRECRNLVITHDFINKKVSKKDVAFSHFNIFTNGNDYCFGGLNSFNVNFDQNVLTITRDFIPTTEYKLISDEVRAEVLRQMCYIMKKDDTGNKVYFKVNGKFVKEIGPFVFELTEDAASASAIDSQVIDILKEAFSLYIDSPKYEFILSKNYFLYINENSYELSKEVRTDSKSKLISKDAYEGFIKAFNGNNEQIKCIAMSNNHYLSLNLKTNLSFDLSFEKSALNATTMTNEQVKALEKVLGLSLQCKNIEYVYKADETYNIINVEKTYNILDAYNNFMSEVEKSRYTFKPFYDENQLMKTVSRVGAYEHLARFYLKSLNDSYKVFRQILSKSVVENIAISGSTATADIVGLSMACEELGKTVNVTLIETAKWGYYPKALISDKINFKGAYRIPLSGLPRNIIEEFDLIYLGKNFSSQEDLSSFFEDLKDSNKKIIFANVNYTWVNDSFYNAMVSSTKVSRRHIATKVEDFIDLGIDLKYDNIDPKSTYVSIVKYENNKYVDLLRSVK